MNELLESWTGLLLDDPWMLLLGGLVPVGLWMRRRGGAPAVRFAPGEFLDGMPRSMAGRLTSVPCVLRVVGLLLVVVALARPVERVPLPRRAVGVDIVLCLDVSSSMTATDMGAETSRLQASRAAAARFVSGRPEDRIGLVQFARYPDLRCPLTLDHDALQRFLADMAVVDADGPEDRTGIGTAVARSAQLLRSSDSPSKVLILLTDGEENVATAETPDEIGPLEAARMCEELRIRAYVIAAGVGKRGPNGEVVPLDQSQVRRLAEVTGGRFFEARDADAVTGVYAQIDQLEKVEFDEPRFELEDRFLPFLLVAVLLLLSGAFLEATVLGVAP